MAPETSAYMFFCESIKRDNTLVNSVRQAGGASETSVKNNDDCGYTLGYGLV